MMAVPSRSLRFVTLLALTLAFVASGCITAPPDGSGDGGDEEPQPVPVERTSSETFEAEVGTQVHATEANAADAWEFTFPETVQSISVELSWGSDPNEFTLRATGPSDERTFAATGREASGTITPAEAGTWSFAARATGAVVEDSLRLDVTYVWIEHVFDNGTESTPVKPPVSVQRDGDGWRATMLYARSGAVGSDVTLDVHAFNGAVELMGSGDKASVRMTAWARAPTEERARELVQKIAVQVSVSADQVKAVASRGSLETGNNEGIGASAELIVPATVSGAVSSSNGAVDVVGIDAAGLTVKSSNGAISLDVASTGKLVVETSNGGISGDIGSHDDVSLKTSNGGIDVRVDPQRSHALNVGTSNAAVDLELVESDSIGYRLDADTSNGVVSETMDDASLSVEGEDSATLTSRDYASRSIQVSGSVDSSNGDIDFASA